MGKLRLESGGLKLAVEIGQDFLEGVLVGLVPVGVAGHLAGVFAVGFEGEGAGAAAFADGDVALNDGLKPERPHAWCGPCPETLDGGAGVIATGGGEGVATAGKGLGKEITHFGLNALAGGQGDVSHGFAEGVALAAHHARFIRRIHGGMVAVHRRGAGVRGLVLKDSQILDCCDGDGAIGGRMLC